ncbi:MAG TPA: ATP-binding cassette domain-containing protein [Enteractinococcus helveticum]|uniref:ATP-binding cassette domain-containing protein n=1 Tax=Enteractinococcus helveticum TaxID=1837282 RepID=A0A921FND8_9MICC|nr:ABC-F family ATP-binding cassette domain-containing protein [Enteractinococcus helveticum]HJF15289.1 ATP-binding cassette domain-containing protein [Enteractinococcus helveticum]
MPFESKHPAHSGAQITLHTIEVTLGGSRILHNLDLAVTPSSRIGIVGENGRGKTTLLHILTGRLTPDGGTVTRHGSIAVAEQEMSADDGRTVGDVIAATIEPAVAALAELDTTSQAVAAGETGAEEQFAVALEYAQAIDAWDAERRVTQALEALDAETDREVVLSDLSVGQRYRVRLACLLGGHHDFLLLDEPTNHLDRSGLDFLTQSLRDRNGGVVVVSHDRALLADIAETVLSLDPTPDDRPRLYGDGYAGYRERSRAERIQWEQEYARQQVEHTKLQNDLQTAQDRLISGWRPPKGTGKHARATRAASTVRNVQRRQDALEAHSLSVPEPPLQLKFPAVQSRSSATMLSAEQVSLTDRLPSTVSLQVAGGDRLVVTGPNGAGKSTLLQVLAKQLVPTTGSVQHHASARIALLEQESVLPLQQRVGAYFEAHVQRLIARRVVSERQGVSLRELGLLGSAEMRLRVGELSMGQQRRLELALVLAMRPNVLLLDEPTNHLSIRLVDELTEALENTEAAVIVATHDRQLLRDTDHWPSVSLENTSVSATR